MKHVGIIILFICLTYQTQAQIGINTTSPQGILHIDSKGDTNGDTNTSDDIIVLDNARLGIGTTSPSANLDLRGKLRITDGSEGNLKILLSDDDGLAHWGSKSMKTVIGVMPTSLAQVEGGDWTTAPRYVGANITLTQGSWVVYFEANYKSWAQQGGNIWWDLSTSETTRNKDGGRCLSNFTYPNTICSSYVVYLVTTTTPVTYYMWGTAKNLSSGNYLTYVGNGQIYAIQIN